MHLVISTTAWLKRISGLAFTLFFYSIASAQENSPYSRYGIGDLVPNQNIVNRGMGGISAGYTNPQILDLKYIKPDVLFQSINLVNPASIAGMNNTIFDIGGEVDIRTLKSNTSPAKYTATNTIISYLQLGFPLAKQKWIKKGNYWGLSFGLKPVSRTNYKIEKRERKAFPPLTDSMYTLNEGSGGLNQVNIATAVKIKNFSIGVSGGYSFGNKTYSTKINLINDTVNYYKSNSEANSRYSGFFLNVGVQYAVKMKNGLLNLGAYSNLQQNLKAKRDYLDATYSDDGTGGIITIDTVNYKTAEKTIVHYFLIKQPVYLELIV